jgi:tetratricopeptide (TPR) repeat protein
LFKFSRESWARANECFQQAAALDPGYAQPHADLGLHHFLAGTNGLAPLREVVPVVRAEARKALELDPSEPGPHFLLGAVAAAHDYDWKESEEQFRVALAATSVVANARWAYASLYLQPLGRLQEAAAEMEREVEQDPLNVTWRAVLGSHLTHAGMFDRSIEEVRKALDIDKDSWVSYFTLTETYATVGRIDEAVAAAENAYRLAPWSSLPAGCLAGLLVRKGDRRRAAEIVQTMGDSPMPIMGRVLYHLLCSEADEAADWYEKVIEAREPFALIFAAAPVNRCLRESPRWPKLAKMMNLPEGG